MLSKLQNLPTFSEDKLKQLLHYTDNEDNPSYKAYKSNAFFKIYSGAKGVSKSFGRMIETIYRIVNDKDFCSVWCRNQYNHIKTTLKPMVTKVLNFLAEEHNLDYRDCFNITNEAVYWNYPDEGQGRAIFFQNWEKIQAFQGLTLSKPTFYFGELVVDEPIEDVSDSEKLPHELEEIYEKQLEKLPLLIQNTVLRESNNSHSKNINVSFLYNIFTLKHFLITDYHNLVIPIVNDNEEPNNEVLEELIKNHYIQREDMNYKNGVGLIVTMFSKYFIPKKNLNMIQMKMLDDLRETNYRLWVITVVGFAFNFKPKNLNYFMNSILFDDEGEYRKDIVRLVGYKKFNEMLQTNKPIGIFHGYDHGIHDNASICTVALFESGDLVVIEAIEDIKTKLKKVKTQFINREIIKLVVKHVQTINEKIESALGINYINEKFINGYTSTIYSDHNATIEALNIEFNTLNINSIAVPAVRKPSQAFGIADRQRWQKWLFQNKLIKFLNNGSVILVKKLASQAIDWNEDKRNEDINPRIYDLINAFEMACSVVFKYQYIYKSNGEYKE
ncbi:hypothetical protein [Mycoplasma simbae]|uniref:hypothetical protein n=1 Tax=Mycoplasma simbae TaxID=36744 RepID=UPI000495A013|nr:hypothetical protein [Mycoplasma simbae]